MCTYIGFFLDSVTCILNIFTQNDCIATATYVYCMYAHVYCIIIQYTSCIVTIVTPPENITVCRGSDVTISCGYGSLTALPITWIINGTSFTLQEILNSPLYQLNNLLTPIANSLTVFSINGATTFQCIVQSTPNTTSTRGTVTVTNGM